MDIENMSVQQITQDNLLIELGTEELPPKSLSALSNSFAHLLTEQLKQNRLEFGEVWCGATPRRLSVIVKQVAVRQHDIEQLHYGPRQTQAFDEKGEPKPAVLGFARKWGKAMDELMLSDEDEPRLFVRHSIAGQPVADLIQDILLKTIQDLPVSRRMRWGDNEFEFVRPLRWLLVLLGEQVLPCQLMGINAEQWSMGHPVHHPQPVEIQSAVTYCQQLMQAQVMVDIDQRRERIEQQAQQLALTVGAKVVLSPALMDEINCLVEWPVALMGTFDPEFLKMPARVLICSIQVHQKYFHLLDENEQLLPLFITVSNLESAQPEQVIHGNERVLRPRLQDAQFFFNSDLKIPLQNYANALSNTVFQNQLGSMAEKAERIHGLVKFLVQHWQLAIQLPAIERATLLSKADLLSKMVTEFPTLQGIMGACYARHQGESDVVSNAIEEQYLPAYAQDNLPQTNLGSLLSLADSLDTVCGIFSIGKEPSGAGDPFAIRRNSNAIMRILVEQKRSISLDDCIVFALQQYRESKVFQGDEKSLRVRIVNYLLERLRPMLEHLNGHVYFFRAVKQKGIVNPMDFYQRCLALQQFSELSQSSALASSHKRVANILRKNIEAQSDTTVDPTLLQQDEEKELYTTIMDMEKKIVIQPVYGTVAEPMDYLAQLHIIVEINEVLHRFFDKVMVMVAEQQLRNNRMALLQQVNILLTTVGDISQLATHSKD